MARRFKELNASTKDLPELTSVNRQPRPLSSPEASEPEVSETVE